MPAHVRPRSRETSTRPLATRPATVVALGIAVSTLTITAMFQAPAQAGEGVTSPFPSSSLNPDVGRPTPADATDTRLARLVEIRQDRLIRQEERQERQARQERRERRQEKRERREARQDRRERRQDARAAARAAARAPVGHARSRGGLVSVIR